MTGQIILLHGPSSAGKSTLARLLQDALPQPFWHISIDHLRDHHVLPMHRYKTGEFDWQHDRAQIFSAFHASIATYAKAVINVIAEHIIDTEGWIDELVDLFSDIDVYFVGLHCDLTTLTRREQVRGDRPTGSAQGDFFSVHQNRCYDLILDTTHDPHTNVDAIRAGWRSGKRSSEFS